MTTPPPRDDGPTLREMGARIRARRADLGISQERLALRSGLHWTFVGQVERGQRNPSTTNLLRIAYGLGVDAAELVTGLPVPLIEQKPTW